MGFLIPVNEYKLPPAYSVGFSLLTTVGISLKLCVGAALQSAVFMGICSYSAALTDQNKTCKILKQSSPFIVADPYGEPL